MAIKRSTITALLVGMSFGVLAFGAQAEDAWKYKVDVWSVPFDMHSKTTTMEYVPLAKADKNYKICASFPHMKEFVLAGRRLRND